MIFEISAKDFWEKTEKLYSNDSRHIRDMEDTHYKLGLKYLNTSYLTNTCHLIGFSFKVIDQEKFFLAKLKYGF